MSSRITENKGQWDPRIRFLARTDLGSVAFGDGCVYYNVFDKESVSEVTGNNKDRSAIFSEGKPEGSTEGTVIRVEFEGSGPTIPRGDSLIDRCTNYFIGNDPSRWATGVPSYDSVIYEDAWNGIDIVFRTADGSLKYDILMDPRSDPSEISFRVEGHQGMELTGGDLTITAHTGARIIDSELVASYGDGHGDPIGVRFDLRGPDSYGFELSPYDSGRPVVIDPLVFSTYYGGTVDDNAYDVAVDASGNFIVTGQTWSTDFPVSSGAYQKSNAGWFDIIVFKIGSDGTTLFYATYVGGSDFEICRAIDIDDDGNAYVTGATFSTDFPVTTGAYNETHWNTIDYADVFVFELNSRGSALVFSTYVAGELSDVGFDISVDGSGMTYVVGGSESDNFPTTTGAYDEKFDGIVDIVLFVLSSDGTSLKYSTYIGGTDQDLAYALYLDGTDYVYFTGSTYSSDFPVTTSARYVDWSDVIVVKFDMVNSLLLYSHMFGGDDEEEGYGIDVDGSGNAYICGYTWGGTRMTFPTTRGAFSETFNGGSTDMFATKVDAKGSTLLYSTYIGGTDDEDANAIRVDGEGIAHICGYTWSTDFPTTPTSDYPDFIGGDIDAVVLKLDAQGSSLLYSTYLGGNEDESAYNLQILESGNAVIVGETDSSMFPTTPGVLYTRNQGSYDCFVLEMDFSTPPSPPTGLVVEGGVGHIKMSWMEPDSDGGSPITHYNVYRGPTAGDLKKLAETPILEYNDTTADIGTPFFYAVSANNSIGESARTLPVDGMSFGIPSSPLNLAGTVDLDSIDLDWDPPSFTGGALIAGYRVYKRNETGTSSMLVQLGSGTTSYSDTELELGMRYHYSVTAYNSVGESPKSPEINLTMPDIPSGPRNLTVRSGDNYIHLSWDGPISDGGLDLAGFRCYKGEEGEAMSLLTSLGEDVRSYNDTSVTNGVRYYYNITAFNDAGESPPVRIGATPLSVPGPPLVLTPISGDGFVDLFWDSPTDTGGAVITGFRIYNVNQTEDEVLIGEVDEDVFEFNHTDLINGVEYTYFVTCLNEVGESGKSSKVSATPLGLPDPPKNITAKAGNGHVVLTWEGPDDNGGSPVTQFTVMRGTVSGDLSSFVLVVNTSDMSVNDTMVENGMTYFYILRSVSGVGPSPFSAEVSSVPRGPPTAPLNLTAVPGSGTVQLSWIAPLGEGGATVLGFKLFKGTTASEQSEIASLGADELSYEDTDVTNGVTYYYHLIAFNAVGTSPSTPVVDARPIGLPSSPKDLTVVESEGAILLTWGIPDDDGGSDMTGFDIHRSEDGGPFELIGSVGPGVTSYLDEDIKEGVEYRYKVTAKTAAGSTESSVTAGIKIEGAATGSDIGLFVGIAVAALVVLLLLALVLFLLLRKKKGPAETPPPEEPPVVPPVVPQMYQQIPPAQTMAGYPAQVQAEVPGPAEDISSGPIEPEAPGMQPTPEVEDAPGHPVPEPVEPTIPEEPPSEVQGPAPEDTLQ